MPEPRLCQCGCGQPTKIATATSRAKGHVKGQPMRFLNGHHNKVTLHNGGRRMNGGYVQIYAPSHPRSRKNYVREHILIVEKVLGRYLRPPEEVHHVDASRANNENRNLVVCQDRAYHMLLHQRARALEACGHAGWRQCRFCKQWDDPTNLDFYRGGNPQHRPCGNADTAERKRRARRRARRSA